MKLLRFRESEVKEEFNAGLTTNVMVMKIDVAWQESCLMLQVKSVVVLKTNPGILKRGGALKMWM